MKLNRKAMLGAACAAMFGLNAMSQSADPQQLQAAIQKKLSSSHFKGVTVQLNNGVATLGGTVELYEYKASADDRAHHVKGVTAVDNEIQVAGKRVDDAELRQQLAKKIAYDREGWPDQAFNDITVSVSNGVVTLGGNAAVPWAKDSAIAVARNTPGATDVVDDITVDPTSEFDNQTRLAVFRAVYGYPTLNQYNSDPLKPIRITVVNGNVTLGGVVNTQMDKNVAGIQANQVPGVFKVTNDLQVANDKIEKK